MIHEDLAALCIFQLINYALECNGTIKEYTEWTKFFFLFIFLDFKICLKSFSMRKILCTSMKNKIREKVVQNINAQIRIRIQSLMTTLENLIFITIHNMVLNIRFVPLDIIPKVIPLTAWLEGKYAMTSSYSIVKLFSRFNLRERLNVLR